MRLRSVIATVLLIALGVVAGGYLVATRPSLNPFAEETVDRTGPSVLESLVDIQEFHAASGYYETVVDIEKDTKHLPSWISGERVLYVGKGSVDGIVDFSDLDESRVTTSPDKTSVTIELPSPTVGTPVLDIEHSYVANHDKGLANRFKGSDLEREAQLKAIDQMTTAATGGDELVDKAKDNTESMLRGLLGALGYTGITIGWDPDAR